MSAPIPALDVTQALRDAENALRDFIAAELSRRLGSDWESKCGVSEERLSRWRERKEVEARRQETGVVEERLIYYADFYDLKTILKRNWTETFSAALGDWRTMEVYLAELEKLRDPDAHRRELLPHQKQLAAGISGEIRTRIVRYRSRRDTSEDTFPRIESARDSLGNIWVPESMRFNNVFTGMVLRPGDLIDFVVTARDPEDQTLEYGIRVAPALSISWQAGETFSVRISNENIARHWEVAFYVRSPRPYHASGTYDDRVAFIYGVLPTP